MKAGNIIMVTIAVMSIGFLWCIPWVIPGVDSWPWDTPVKSVSEVEEKVTEPEIRIINGFECIRYQGRWEYVNNFCPNCGFFTLEPYCRSCGLKQLKNCYYVGCLGCGKNPWPGGIGSYCEECGAKIGFVGYERVEK